MRMRIALEGDARFRRAVGKLALPEADPIYRRSLTRSAELVRDTTRDDFLAGQALRVVTGELRRSIRISERGLPKYIEIGSSLVQAPVLHFGWPGKHIQARPYLGPSLDRNVARFPPIWVQEMEREVRAAG